MKIIVDKKGESQSPKIIINTEGCNYPYAIINALKLALELDGYTEQTINEVFGRNMDVVCKNQTEE